jgi:hypothetical protein
MTWEPGRDRVQQLIDDGEVERVAPDVELARWLLADAGRHITSASAAKATGDMSGAYQLAYDAFRKSAASLLEAQGCVQPAEAAILPYKKPSPPSSAPLCASSGLLAGFAGHETVSSTQAAILLALPPKMLMMQSRSRPRRTLPPGPSWIRTYSPPGSRQG